MLFRCWLAQENVCTIDNNIFCLASSHTFFSELAAALLEIGLLLIVATEVVAIVMQITIKCDAIVGLSVMVSKFGEEHKKIFISLYKTFSTSYFCYFH